MLRKDFLAESMFDLRLKEKAGQVAGNQILLT